MMHMFFGGVIVFAALVGLAYLIWVEAKRETGGLKGFGQVIAIALAFIALVLFLYGGIYGGLMSKGSWRCPMMSGQGDMMMHQGGGMGGQGGMMRHHGGGMGGMSGSATKQTSPERSEQ